MARRSRRPDLFLVPPRVDNVGDTGSNLCPSVMAGMPPGDDSNDTSDVSWLRELCRRLLLERPELSRSTVIRLPVESRQPPAVEVLSPPMYITDPVEAGRDCALSRLVGTDGAMKWPSACTGVVMVGARLVLEASVTTACWSRGATERPVDSNCVDHGFGWLISEGAGVWIACPP
jgi:hypothetical protein